MVNKIKILIVDDHQVVRKGLKLLFSAEPSFVVVENCESVALALEYLQGNEVNVLVTDISMPNMTGIELAKEIKSLYPDIRIMILTMHLDENYIVEAIEAGALGYLVKDSSEKDIIEAVKVVNNKELFLTKSVSDILAKSLIKRNHVRIFEKEVKLTTREKEILKYIVDGLSNKMVSAELNISERTVNAHRYNIMKKLKAKNSADLVRISIKNELVC